MTIEIVRPEKAITEVLSARSRAYRKELANALAVAAVGASSRRNDLNPPMTLETRPLRSLRAPVRNVRKRDLRHDAEIAASIRELGMVKPLIVTPEGEIVDGVSTYHAAQALGMSEVPCVVVDGLTPDQVRLVRIALNRLGERGGWELPELKIEFEHLMTVEAPIEISGFSLPEIDQIVLDSRPGLDKKANACPELSEEPAVTRPGDLWQLGRHRVLCADATKPESYRDLFARGDQVQMIFSDPPYNIRIDGFAVGSGETRHREFVAASGEMSDQEFVDFLAGYLMAAAEMLADGGIAFVCMDWRHCEHVLTAARRAELSVLNMVCWSKGQGGLGGLYRSAHELVFVLKKGAGPHINNIELGRHGRDRCNVWVYPGANRIGSSANKELANHPTPKPVELVADAILDVSERGDLVLDPFLGSGTTIIAAEKTKRTAYGLELDPRYVDRIVVRFEAFTGEAAIHADTGVAFSEMKARRARAEDEAGLVGLPPAETDQPTAVAAAAGE